MDASHYYTHRRKSQLLQNDYGKASVTKIKAYKF